MVYRGGEMALATKLLFSFFSVERSANGVDFNVLSTVTGNGNSSLILKYSFEEDSYKLWVMSYEFILEKYFRLFVANSS